MAPGRPERHHREHVRTRIDGGLRTAVHVRDELHDAIRWKLRAIARTRMRERCASASLATSAPSHCVRAARSRSPLPGPRRCRPRSRVGSGAVAVSLSTR